MPKPLRWMLATAAVLVVLAVALIGTVLAVFPRVSPAPALAVQATPALLARGRYLFDHGCACVSCHSQRDWTKLNGPVKPGSEGRGGERFAAAEGVPGVVHARNLTPAALKDCSDGEIWRSLTAGVARDGTALFPLMPWQHYAGLAEEDLHALIAYLRTLPAQENAVAARRLDFPVNLLVRLEPRDATPPARRPEPGTPAYAAYVANAAACLHCHSPMVQGAYVAGREWSGGVEFPMPGLGIVRSSNLTPDTTGLAGWTKEAFIARFRAGVEQARDPVGKGDFTSPMPWAEYGGMSDADLGAIWDFLRTLPPVRNPVEKLTPAR